MIQSCGPRLPPDDGTIWYVFAFSSSNKHTKTLYVINSLFLVYYQKEIINKNANENGMDASSLQNV